MIADRIWKSLLAFASLAVILGNPTMVERAYAAEPDQEIVIVAFGDSLVAGYQLPPAAAFPVQLEKALKDKGYNVRVMNAGVSGDTAADGLARFDWAMPDEADAVILEFGANDALRGIQVEETKKALSEMLQKLKARDLEVLLAGMEAPRNWGQDYVGAFRAMYESLAKEYNALLYPFFLEGVALNSSLNLDDGLHPNAEGVRHIVDKILPKVEQLIQRVEERRSGQT